MSKYLFLYWMDSSQEQPQPSPEEMQEQFKQWGIWKDKFKEQVVEVGDGLKPGGKTLKSGQVTDGPFTEAKEIIGGYSIVQADTLDSAMVVARECPIAFVPGASIEVRELAGF